MEKTGPKVRAPRRPGLGHAGGWRRRDTPGRTPAGRLRGAISAGRRGPRRGRARGPGTGPPWSPTCDLAPGCDSAPGGSWPRSADPTRGPRGTEGAEGGARRWGPRKRGRDGWAAGGTACIRPTAPPGPDPQQTEGFRKRWFTMDDRRLLYFKDPLVRRPAQLGLPRGGEGPGGELLREASYSSSCPARRTPLPEGRSSSAAGRAATRCWTDSRRPPRATTGHMASPSSRRSAGSCWPVRRRRSSACGWTRSRSWWTGPCCPRSTQVRAGRGWSRPGQRACGRAKGGRLSLSSGSPLQA